MAALETLRQLPESLQLRHGVITLFGYGIRVSVDRGHLTLEDGIGADRRLARLPRVGHGLRRLVVIGADGFVSLAALRWLADQDATFVMLNRDGSVLATTGPVRPSDARLRRAQALAGQSDAGLSIARELIGRKLAGQEQVARGKLLDSATADVIARHREALATAGSLDTIRLIESRAAAAYWSAWRTLPVMFPKNDLPRVPDHWRVFGTRVSPLTGSPRLAANPPNAILNYLYAVLESESSLAAAALGLDPGLGFIHMDAPARDSLACDLMEAIRPQVDAFLLDWITRQLVLREWFFEQRDGNCRLMGTLAARLAETAPMWARAVAPVAEWVARQLWHRQRKPSRAIAPPTRLTGSHKREARGAPPLPPAQPAPRLDNLCQDCGKPITDGGRHCGQCAVPYARQHLVDAARAGRVAAQSAEAQTRRSETQRRNAAARAEWEASTRVAPMDPNLYDQQIKPALAKASTSAIARALGVSRVYAGAIRAGRRRPHPRHWQELAGLVGVSA